MASGPSEFHIFRFSRFSGRVATLNRGKLSQVAFPYKVVINNDSVTIEGNPILFNRTQGFAQNFSLPKY